MGKVTLNARAMRVADELAGSADELGVTVGSAGKARLIDAGVKQTGSLQAGVMVARACLADLAHVCLVPGWIGDRPHIDVVVDVAKPVEACMASQYAGWQINLPGVPPASGKSYFAMGSGPMRAAYGKEELFDDTGGRESPDSVVGVLETGKLPLAEVACYIAQRCRVDERHVTLIAARTASLVGSVQIAARSVETALHKLHALEFDLSRVVAGFGAAPLPPVAKDDMAAIGRTNDAVLYGARVTLMCTGDDESLQTAGQQLPAGASRDYGQPFAQIFARYDHDFYKIDPLLFSPALITLQNITTGRSFTFGKVDAKVLAESFGFAAANSL
ncbi:MAG: methenyltetrahydromethanopterin cyclohydrolase [Phycisphaeraceae bacterium]